MLTLVKRLVREEEGQTMAEYALIIVAVAFLAIVGFKLLGEGLSDLATDIGSALTNKAVPTL